MVRQCDGWVGVTGSHLKTDILIADVYNLYNVLGDIAILYLHFIQVLFSNAEIKFLLYIWRFVLYLKLMQKYCRQYASFQHEWQEAINF